MQLKSGDIHLSASDLVNYLGCKHLTELDRDVALGNASKPDWNNPALAILQKKGQEHEDAYVAHLKATGLSLIDLTDQPLSAVEEAISKGYDIITQATFKSNQWTGRSDILRKIPGESKYGNYSYEVEDTKLAQVTKAGTVLQLCLYTELLGEMQGTVPKKMYVVKPGEDFPTDSYNYAEFRAYFSLIKNKLEGVIANNPEDTYPVPVSKCDTCRWWKQCNKQWHDDDHLSLVAGLQNSHRKELEGQEIETLTEYAREEKPYRQKPEKGNPETYKKIHNQAKVQLRGREQKKKVYDLLPFEELRGLNRLPHPSKGDLYFDIEGDHFYDDGGLEYLLGLSFQNSKGKLIYDKYWGMNRKEEKTAFTSFMKFVMNRWKEYPGFYIYHYAPYEPSAIKRLASRHAIHEKEVDQLLRAERFIDLYAVIKETLQASVERYSLKDMELFTNYTRQVDLGEASEARRRLGAALELDALINLPEMDLETVERYNEDDCLATEALHQWLEDIYQEQVKLHIKLTRPELKTGDASEVVDEKDEYARQLFQKLVDGLPEDPNEYSNTERARWLLAHMVEYFRREMRTAYWEYFRVHALEDDEMLDERDGIAYLIFDSDVDIPKSRTPGHRYTFPPQEISRSLNKGTDLIEIQGNSIGTIHDISVDEGWVEIKKRKAAADIHPTSVHAKDIISTAILASALHAFVESIIEDGIESDSTFQAGRDLLLQNPPRLKGSTKGLFALPGEEAKHTAIRIASQLNNSILPIQGPPGTGKTYIGGLMILELLKEGKKIGVTAISHKVILNLLEKALKLGKEKQQTINAMHVVKEVSTDLPEGLEETNDKVKAIETLDNEKVVGATVFFWARDDSVETLDYLFVDEAGQMSLSNVLAMGRCSKNIILLGDPQQLEQPQQGAHPEGADISALEHLLQGKPTIDPDKGLFLETTWRLPPTISNFTSEQYYENRLLSKSELTNHKLEGNSPFAGSGLFYAPVEHDGNQNKSLEEVNKIESLIKHLLEADLNWIDIEGIKHKLTSDDILIVAPYNVQVSELIERLPGMKIGTVDKFQGQEAPVVIYSMTSSSPEDAPRGMSFLYNPNRFNVATSRAQCISIMVCSPNLMEPECHTIDQMQWANGLCRYREMANEQII